MARRIIWADIGMVVAVVTFIAIVALFQDETFFAPLMIAYMAAVVVFAFICEWTATTSKRDQTTAHYESEHRLGGVPLPQ